MVTCTEQNTVASVSICAKPRKIYAFYNNNPINGPYAGPTKPIFGCVVDWHRPAGLTLKANLSTPELVGLSAFWKRSGGG